MGAFGQIGYSQTNKLYQPSGAVWGDCPSLDLLAGDQGYANFQDFKMALPLTTAPNWNIDSGTFTYNTHYDSVVSITTGATTLDDAGIATRPLGPIVPGSGRKIWFETLISVASISAVNGVFVGLVNAAALGSKLLIKQTSATKNSNQIGTTSGGQSGYGFWLHADTPTNLDAVWFNNLQTATGTTDLEATTATASGLVLANVLTAPANNPNPANLAFVPQTPPGVLVATATAAATGYTTVQQQYLAADPSSVPQTLLPNSATGATGFVKFGLRYDGFQYLYFYVNGNQVAKMLISSAQDINSDFAGVVDFQALGTGQPVLNVGWMHAAALLEP